MQELSTPSYWNPNFLLSVFWPSHLRPDLELDSLADLDISHLDQQGIKGCIIDVDNTICRYRGTQVDELVRDSFERLKDRYGNQLCILSNTSSNRRQRLTEYFGAHVVQSEVRKPRIGAFEAALRYLGTRPEETAMIGDRLATDIAGASRAGLYSIKVRALHLLSEPWHIMITRGFENFVLAFYDE